MKTRKEREAEFKAKIAELDAYINVIGTGGEVHPKNKIPDYIIFKGNE